MIIKISIKYIVSLILDIESNTISVLVQPMRNFIKSKYYTKRGEIGPRTMSRYVMNTVPGKFKEHMTIKELKVLQGAFKEHY